MRIAKKNVGHALGVVVAVGVAGTAVAQYAITNSTIDSGGGALIGSTYEVVGTIGQTDATQPLGGSTYQAVGGFWGGFAPSACAGDVDGDGNTGLADFNTLAGNFGQVGGATRADGDLDGDGNVGLSDFNLLAGDFGCIG